MNLLVWITGAAGRPFGTPETDQFECQFSRVHKCTLFSVSGQSQDLHGVVCKYWAHSGIAHDMATFFLLAVGCGNFWVVLGPITDFWTQHGVDSEIRVDERKVRLSNCWSRLSGRTAYKAIGRQRMGR